MLTYKNFSGSLTSDLATPPKSEPTQVLSEPRQTLRKSYRESQQRPRFDRPLSAVDPVRQSLQVCDV